MIFKLNKQTPHFKQIISLLVAGALSFLPMIAPAGAQTVSTLPQPGTMVTLSPAYSPVIIKGIKVFPDQPFQLDFIVDGGDEHLEGEAFEKEAMKLVKYFMVSLTMPEDEMWVNLSPYEKDEIIPKKLQHTEIGQDLLEQDYLLKQLTASLIYPEDELGREFWKV
jgi:hypothetical protein